jgi:hypothetical protein
MVGSQTAMNAIFFAGNGSDGFWEVAIATKAIWDAGTPSGVTTNYIDGPTADGKGVQISPNTDGDGSYAVPEIDMSDANTVEVQTKTGPDTEAGDFALSVDGTELFGINDGWSEQTGDVSGVTGTTSIDFVVKSSAITTEKASIANISLL